MNTSHISERDILALFLSSGSGGDKAFSISDMLYKRFGNLYGMSNTLPEELVSIKGVGKKRADLIKLLPILLEYYLQSKVITQREKFSMKELVNYFSLTLRHLKFEMFSLASIDVRKRIIGVENMFRGSIESATVYPREIVQRLLNVGASYIVFAHNHPSGDPSPSSEDIELTKGLFKLCGSVNIKMIDHVIIAGNSRYSFRREGLIDTLKDNLCNKFGG